jgi:succinate-semialdehyde dehydrogenase
MLLAGNTYVLKHAPNVMGSAYLLRDAFAAAGAPEGVFEVVHTDPEGVSAMIEDPRIVAVAVTGSVRAGAAIARQAGAVLKKSILELGGSDAFIVLADADVFRIPGRSASRQSASSSSSRSRKLSRRGSWRRCGR